MQYAVIGILIKGIDNDTKIEVIFFLQNCVMLWLFPLSGVKFLSLFNVLTIIVVPRLID